MTDSLHVELDALRAENARLKREGTDLRSQLFFLREESEEAREKSFERHATVNDIGQAFCPRCRKLVWEPGNIPAYWRRCQYANKSPPQYCPNCGQHIIIAPADLKAWEYEEDPLKKEHKGEQRNGTWYHRR